MASSWNLLRKSEGSLLIQLSHKGFASLVVAQNRLSGRFLWRFRLPGFRLPRLSGRCVLDALGSVGRSAALARSLALRSAVLRNRVEVVLVGLVRHDLQVVGPPAHRASWGKQPRRRSVPRRPAGIAFRLRSFHPG